MTGLKRTYGGVGPTPNPDTGRGLTGLREPDASTILRRLDLRRMPPGYGILQIGDHCMWVCGLNDALDWTKESRIHWSRAAVRRGAWAHYRRTEEGVSGE